jgi:hypothetical protein
MISIVVVEGGMVAIILSLMFDRFVCLFVLEALYAPSYHPSFVFRMVSHAGLVFPATARLVSLQTNFELIYLSCFNGSVVTFAKEVFCDRL